MKRKKYFLDIGHAIKVQRIKRRLTQKELAEKIGLSPNYLSLIENRDKYPSEEILEKIAKGLETTSNRIIEEAKIFEILKGEEFELRKMIRELLEQIDASELKRIIDEEDKIIKGGKNGDL